MLRLQSEELLDICRISKLLVRYDVKANVTKKDITLDGEITDELLRKLLDIVPICKVQIFNDKIESKQNIEKHVKEEIIQQVTLVPQNIKKYNLLFPTVKRGEVYICDFGEPYGGEQGNKRYAIVVQNDSGNIHSNTTIVLPCTARHKKKLPVHQHFIFSKENMLDYDISCIGDKENIVMAEQIRTVDKTRLRKFLGTMTPSFMDEMQKIIDISLNLRSIGKRESTGKTALDVPRTSKNRKDLNIVQMQILSFVDIKELFNIADSKESSEIKIEKILELFGFNMNKNGVQYLSKAILISLNESYFNLETLSESISKIECGINKYEIKRLIVVRVKELFKLKKSPTTDFIRVVNSVLSKKGE